MSYTQTQTIQNELSDWLRSAPRPTDENFSEGELKRLRLQLSEVHSATSHGFAVLGLPLRLRPFVAAIIAASNGETKFKARYKILVSLLFREGDGRTYEAKKSEVRRLVKGLRSWQEQNKITLCSITGGGKKDGENGEEYHDTEFELVFLDAIAKTLVNSPQPEKMRAAVRTQIASMMKLPSFDGRWTPKTPTPEQLQQRNQKAAITMVIKSCKTEEEIGGDPLAYFEETVRKMRAEIEKEFDETPYQEGVSPSLNSEIKELEADGVCRIRHTPPPSESSAPDAKVAPSIGTKVAPSIGTLEVLKRNAEAAQNDTSPPVFLDAPETQFRNTGGGEAVKAFASVGVSVFKVLFKDDRAKRVREEGDFDSHGLVRHLPEFVARAEREQRSLIVDVKANGKRIIQVDEASAEVLELLKPVSFAQIITSEGNGQAWLALPEALSSDECERIATRLFETLKPLGANRGASGGLRWPGSINFKPERNHFRVHLEYAARGRIVTLEELEAAGLLAPLSDNSERVYKLESSKAIGGAYIFPDYQRCLETKGGDRSRADASFLKICQKRQIPMEEAQAELEQISDRAKEERARGRKDYVSRTARFVVAH